MVEDDCGSEKLKGLPAKVKVLLLQARQLLNGNETTSKKHGFEQLSRGIHPSCLTPDAKHAFVELFIEGGLLEAVVGLIELAQTDMTIAAVNFLGDLTFNSDAGSRAVLLVFQRLRDSILFSSSSTGSQKQIGLLSAAVSLCANVVATCPEGHEQILSLVPTLFLPMMGDPDASDRLVGNTILLLANLSLTCKPQLREMRVADVLLDILLCGDASETRKSVAESVMIILLGDTKCEEIDRLMEANVIEDYCIPILVQAVKNEEFRGMYPHLVYSARLFDALAQCRKYAQALVAHSMVPRELLNACRSQDGLRQLESHDEGRRLAIEALRSFARFKLWPTNVEDELELKGWLALLGEDAHAGVRESAAGLWALVNSEQALCILLVGNRLESTLQLRAPLWKERVVPFLFPLPEG